MARAGSKTPAISAEIEFIARNIAIANAAYDMEIGDERLHALTKRVYDRANQDVRSLLNDLQATLSEAAARASARISWKQYRGDFYWEVGGSVSYGSRGRRKAIGWIYLTINNLEEGGFRLIGSLWPSRGGADGRNHVCGKLKKKLPEFRICLATDYQNRFPEWPEYIIWYERPLHKKVVLEDLAKELGSQGTRFLKTAVPMLKELSS